MANLAQIMTTTAQAVPARVRNGGARSIATIRSMPARSAALLVAALALPMTATCAETSSAAEEVFGGLEPIVHLRTYYWDSQSTTGDKSAAWALGGWAGLHTRWYADALQVGVIGYTSQKLYGPADEGGSQLLTSTQGQITVLGEAFASLRYAGQTFTAYRQKVDEPWVNPYDTRMIPFLFEGYLLRGSVGGWDYTAGYITKAKVRDTSAFAWMSSVAGSSGPQTGLVVVDFGHEFDNGANVRVAEQYLADAYNTLYTDGSYPISIGEGGKLRVGAQYGNQQSVGSDGLGSFNTWMYGLRGLYDRGPITLKFAWTQTSTNRETLAPFGQNPTFLHMMQVDFNDAGEKAWLVGATLDFAFWGAKGLRASAEYGNSHGASFGGRNETDVGLHYAFDESTPVRGLSFGVEGSWLNQDRAKAQGQQLRAYVNYSVPLW